MYSHCVDSHLIHLHLGGTMLWSEKLHKVWIGIRGCEWRVIKYWHQPLLPYLCIFHIVSIQFRKLWMSQWYFDFSFFLSSILMPFLFMKLVLCVAQNVGECEWYPVSLYPLPTLYGCNKNLFTEWTSCARFSDFILWIELRVHFIFKKSNFVLVALRIELIIPIHISWTYVNTRLRRHFTYRFGWTE